MNFTLNLGAIIVTLPAIVILIFIGISLALKFSKKSIKRNEMFTVILFVALSLIAGFTIAIDIEAVFDVKTWLEYQDYFSNVLGQTTVLSGIAYLERKLIKVTAK